MMQSFSVVAQIVRQQPPRTLIDNSSVNGGKKLKFQSELNPENDKPKTKYLQKLINPIKFCHLRKEKINNKEIDNNYCITVEYFFVFKESNFDILGDFTLSMDIKEIEQRCKLRYHGLYPAYFVCNDKKTENSNSVTLTMEYYNNVKAMNLLRINDGTCSPPWENIKPVIIEKYAPKSYRYVDYSDEEMVGKQNYRQQINFYSGALGVNQNKGLEDLQVYFDKDDRSCPGGMNLGFALSGKGYYFKDDADELYKRISEEAANKTPIPKF